MEHDNPSKLEYWPQQSPIDIRETFYQPDEAISFPGYKGPVRGKLTPAADGHGFNFVLDPAGQAHLCKGGRDHPLLQIHFHAPSEHRVAGSDFPLEVHLIHAIPERGNGSANLVVGVFIRPVKDGPAVEAFADLNRYLKGRSRGLRDLKDGEYKEFDPRPCLPGRLDFYRYEGSLTTTPFSETISWVVMRDPVPVRESDLDSILEQATHDARPAQPLNRRYVLRNFR